MLSIRKHISSLYLTIITSSHAGGSPTDIRSLLPSLQILQFDVEIGSRIVTNHRNNVCCSRISKMDKFAIRVSFVENNALEHDMQ